MADPFAILELITGDHSTLRVLIGPLELELPPSLVRLLVAGAGALGEGASLALVSEEAEVSLAEAAKLLGISRQYVDRLVANGVLPARQIPHGRYRKIPARQCWLIARRRMRSGPGSHRSSRLQLRLGFPTDWDRHCCGAR